MKKTKSDYLSYKDVANIVKQNKLQYLLLIGQRSNGKSYACKELAMRAAYEKGELFTYLRRYKSSIKTYMVEEYFADMMVQDDKGRTAISTITNGKYSLISCYRGVIYFANMIDDKLVRGSIAGYAHALTDLETLKSRQFPNVKYIVFEEMIATGLYLYDEPNKLQNYVSTIFRSSTGHVLMIGNTISRIVPYFQEWELDGIPKQLQGTIEIYKFHTKDTETRIGVFLCETLNKSTGMFFGSAAKMIVGGEWDRREQPKLPHDYDDYMPLYHIVFKYSDKAVFLLTFLQLKEDHSKMLWYVEPKTTPIKEGTRVVTPDLSDSRLYTKDFIPINEKEMKIFDYLREDKIAYSDNLTGTEYKRCVEMLRSRTTR